MKQKRLLFTTLSLVLIGVFVWQLFPSHKVEISPRSPELSRGAERKSGQKEMGASEGGNRSEVVGEEKGRPSVLRFRVLDALGGETPGQVFWFCSPKPPHTSRLMAPDLGFRLSKGVQHLDHKGRGEIQVPWNQWTWIRVSGQSSKSQGFQYKLLPPFRGEKEVLFQIKPHQRRIHVFLLHDDLLKPAKHKEIKLFSRKGPSLTLVQSRRTDANGYVTLETEQPGDFLVMGPGVKPRDGPPFMTSLALGGESSINEIALTLVLKEPRITWNFEVDAELPRSQGLPPKLFLKRLDGHLGELFPMPGLLRLGKNKFQFEVPRGSYELSALPLGRIMIPKQFRYLHARKNGQTTTLSLWATGKKIPVKLNGLGYRDYPVTLYPRPKAPLLDDELKLMFCGPYQWHIPKNVAAFPEGVFDLLAFGRFKTWISKKPHSSKEGRMEVQLEPATMVDVRWTGELPRGGAKAVLFVRTERGTFRRIMSRRLIPEGGAMIPAMIARVVVPRGRVVLKIQNAGKEIWEKAFRAKKEKRQVLVVR